LSAAPAARPVGKAIKPLGALAAMDDLLAVNILFTTREKQLSNSK
jgi:hypothetical protein